MSIHVGPESIQSFSDPESPRILASPIQLQHLSPEQPPYSPLSSLESSPSSSESSHGVNSQSENSTTESSQPSSSESMEDIGEPHLLVYPTYKLVGDNIDKHVKPREMRVDAQSQSLHFFNVYAVRDRVDASNLSDQPSLPDVSSIRVEDILPTPDDHTAITTNFAILIGRVLKKHMPFFSCFGSGLEKHIKHEYYQQMSQKSEVVNSS